MIRLPTPRALALSLLLFGGAAHAQTGGADGEVRDGVGGSAGEGSAPSESAAGGRGAAPEPSPAPPPAPEPSPPEPSPAEPSPAEPPASAPAPTEGAPPPAPAGESAVEERQPPPAAKPPAKASPPAEGIPPVEPPTEAAPTEEAPAEEVAPPAEAPADEREEEPAPPLVPELEREPFVGPQPEPLPPELQATSRPETRAAEPPAPTRRPGVLIRTILGLVALLVLAYLGGHPRVRQWEQRLGLAQIVTTGFPFIALGMVARLPSVGVLTDEILVELSPLLRVALGWIGFAVGFRFDVRTLDQVPEGTARAVVLGSAVPFATVVVSASLLLLATTGLAGADLRDPVFLRDGLILGTAGAITGTSAARLILGASAPEWLAKVVRLEEIAGVGGLLLIAAFFRPHGESVTWQLPGTAWIFLTLGMGVAMGILGYAMLRLPSTGAESAVIVLGLLAFAAGAASNLYVSPIVIGFVAGALLVNVPGDYKARLGDTLVRLERPIYLLFLVVVGAIWEFEDWRGWVLLAIFVPARLVGKVLGARLGSIPGQPGLEGRAWALVGLPMGSLSIAIVVSAQVLYPRGLVPVIVTAIIGGALVTEVVVQLLLRAFRRKEGAP